MSQFDSTLLEIPADDIKVGMTIKNIRTHFDEARLKELADSIYRDGLMNPLTVMESEDDGGEVCTELVAGERRLRAIKYIQETIDPDFAEDGIQCIQYIGTIHDAQFVNASENIDREDVDEVDVSAWIHERTEDGITQTELAKKLHRSLAWVNFHHLFHERACDELKQLLREGLISFTAAYELSKNVDEDEQKKWVKKARAFDQKISIGQAQNAGNPNKTSRPGKKAREKMLAKAEALAVEDPDNYYVRGLSLSLRWVDGLLTDEEMDEALVWTPDE